MLTFKQYLEEQFKIVRKMGKTEVVQKDRTLPKPIKKTWWQRKGNKI